MNSERSLVNRTLNPDSPFNKKIFKVMGREDFDQKPCMFAVLLF